MDLGGTKAAGIETRRLIFDSAGGCSRPLKTRGGHCLFWPLFLRRRSPASSFWSFTPLGNNSMVFPISFDLWRISHIFTGVSDAPKSIVLKATRDYVARSSRKFTNARTAIKNSHGPSMRNSMFAKTTFQRKDNPTPPAGTTFRHLNEMNKYANRNYRTNY